MGNSTLLNTDQVITNELGNVSANKQFGHFTLVLVESDRKRKSTLAQLVSVVVFVVVETTGTQIRNYVKC